MPGAFEEITRKFALIRHAKTDKYENDRMRPLAQAGIQQAKDRKAKFNGRVFDLVVVPPTVRGLDTGRLVAGPEVPMIQLGELYPDPATVDPLLNDLFEKLGYASLAKYYEVPGAAEAFRKDGKRAWERVLATAQRHAAKDILVIGSAMFLPAMGEAALGDKHHDLPSVLEMNPGECQGFEFDYWDDDLGKAAKAFRLII